MKHFLFICVFIFSLSSYSQTSIWNNLLQKHVDEQGWVNYQSFKKDIKQLNIYLAYLNNTKPNALWSKNKSKAFWINAYNAYTIKTILDYAPVKSILDIKQDDKNAWQIPIAKVGGKSYTLDFIEHQILRKKYNDPRVHAAINCASISCPPLPNVAFTEKNIDKMLHQKMSNFINQGNRNTISATELKLSKIFEWFQEDFTKQGDLITFINKYSKVKVDENANITYKDYNWNLNKKQPKTH